MSNPKLITRIFGGLGNQLFCYAAARRLALANNADLVLDDVSGFAYDAVYQRHCQLDYFIIPCRKAAAVERLVPFSRPRLALKRSWNQCLPFEPRAYLVQEGIDYGPRLLHFKRRARCIWKAIGKAKITSRTWKPASGKTCKSNRPPMPPT